MSRRFTFEDDTITRHPSSHQPARGLSRLLIARGIVHTQRQATWLFIFVIIFCFAVSAYLLWPRSTVIDIPKEYFEQYEANRAA